MSAEGLEGKASATITVPSAIPVRDSVLKKMSDQELIAFITAETDALNRLMGIARHEGARHAMTIGAALIELKRRVGHKHWIPFVEKNCQFGKRTAQDYMRCARKGTELQAKPKAQHAAPLSVRAVLALARSKPPKLEHVDQRIEKQNALNAINRCTRMLTNLAENFAGLFDQFLVPELRRLVAEADRRARVAEDINPPLQLIDETAEKPRRVEPEVMSKESE